MHCVDAATIDTTATHHVCTSTTLSGSSVILRFECSDMIAKGSHCMFVVSLDCCNPAGSSCRDLSGRAMSVSLPSYIVVLQVNYLMLCILKGDDPRVANHDQMWQ